MQKVKVIIDTDIGSDIDDTLCLAYLLKQPLCEILGVTTCSSEPQKRAEIVDSIGRYIGRELPIYVGRDMPIIGKQKQVAVHQYSVLDRLEHRNEFPQNTAIEYMKQMIEEYPYEIVLVAIGPFTNLGALFTAYPHLANLVKEIVCMGGSFFEEGQAFTQQEWNIFNDAYAAEILFQSGVKITVAGLDVTLRTKTSAQAFLMEQHSKVMEVVALYTENFTKRTDDMYYHDVIPAVYLFEKSIAKTKVGTVHVGLGEDFACTHFTESSDGNIEVMYDLDVKTFFEHYFTIVNR